MNTTQRTLFIIRRLAYLTLASMTLLTGYLLHRERQIVHVQSKTIRALNERLNKLQTAETTESAPVPVGVNLCTWGDPNRPRLIVLKGAPPEMQKP